LERAGLLPRRKLTAVLLLVVLFWVSLGLLVWTHVGYPLAAALAARVRPRRVRTGELTPSVSVIVAAHNEADVIERRLENLLALDYPADRLEIVVASDASDDRTDELVERNPRARLVRCSRGGKVAAQNHTVPQTSGEILAFTDANATWAPDALRKLVRSFADPEVAYVCGRVSLLQPDGTNREGAYWRFEVWLRQQESDLGSVTGGNGAIYAVRRNDYVDVDPRFGHDLAFPYLMVQRGRRAVYEPEALSYEKPSRDNEEEYRRKVRMFEHCWLIVLRGRMLRGLGPVYWLEVVSHRLLRYASGLLHLVLLLTNVALVRHGLVYQVALAVQVAGLLLALAGRFRLPIPGAALAHYYLLVTWATVKALTRYLRFGVPAVWEKAEGTR
jgi:cellulose synthase/poly-beta-1,6-N-acetylglucosamine synthase-like glycosyltransferase